MQVKLLLALILTACAEHKTFHPDVLRACCAGNSPGLCTSLKGAKETQSKRSPHSVSNISTSLSATVSVGRQPRWVLSQLLLLEQRCIPTCSEGSAAVRGHSGNLGLFKASRGNLHSAGQPVLYTHSQAS